MKNHVHYAGGEQIMQSNETCPICEKAYEQSDHLRSHLHRRHRKSEIIETCLNRRDT